jgi:hypothetical protein
LGLGLRGQGDSGKEGDFLERHCFILQVNGKKKGHTAPSA